jgi:hypothetical protein
MKKEIKGYFAQHLIVATSLRIALDDYFEHCEKILKDIQTEQLPDKGYALNAHDELRAEMIKNAGTIYSSVVDELALHHLKRKFLKFM